MLERLKYFECFLPYQGNGVGFCGYAIPLPHKRKGEERSLAKVGVFSRFCAENKCTRSNGWNGEVKNGASAHMLSLSMAVVFKTRAVFHIYTRSLCTKYSNEGSTWFYLGGDCFVSACAAAHNFARARSSLVLSGIQLSDSSKQLQLVWVCARYDRGLGMVLGLVEG